MTAIQVLSETRVTAASRSISRRTEMRRRVVFSLLALGHALICRLIHEKVLTDSGVFEYMGLRWMSADIVQELLFLGLAVAPAFFIPMRLTRTSDLLLIVIYGAVYVPATALFPNIYTGDPGAPFLLTVLSMAGLYIATVMSRLGAQARGVQLGLNDNRYDLMLMSAAIMVVASYVAFVPVQVLTLDFTRLYEFRASFGDQMAKMSPILLYVFVNSALALCPMMIARGLSRKNYMMVGLAVFLAAYTFLVTSYRSLLFIALFVAALTFLVRTRIPPAISIFGFFIGIAIAVVGLDAIAGGEVPVNTFTLHYRLFGNSATITAAYLDLFSHFPKFYYSQSFLSPFIRPPTTIPYPLMVGQEISSVENVWANGNLVADAYANLGYFGVILAYAALGLALMLINASSAAKDLRVAALSLIGPGFYLTNAGLQSAVLSGGLGVTVLLIVLYPKSPAPTVRLRAQAETEAEAGAASAPLTEG